MTRAGSCTGRRFSLITALVGEAPA